MLPTILNFQYNCMNIKSNYRKIARNLLLSAFLLALVQLMAANPLTQDRKGWWKFDNISDPVAAVPGYGLPLALTGTLQTVQGSSVTDGAIEIGPGSYLTMDHQIEPNGGGSYVNEYTLQIDFKVSVTNVWHCFFQTNPDNNNDGDCFINPSGNIGVAATGYSGASITPGEWYRLVITVDNGSFYNYYIDGSLLFTGYVQDIDGRFSLYPELLLFADNDGEDNLITVSEAAIWDRPLNAMEVTELGGFGHVLNPSPYFLCYPFLQTLTDHSAYVSWHDTIANLTKIEYGTTEALGLEQTGNSELLAPMYRWHTVKLENLDAGTRYYYRIVSGSATSAIYHFKTSPASGYQGHIRYLLFSDTQDDSAATGYIIRSAREKMEELYGTDLSESINAVLHTGDIVGNGNVISQWTDQFFRPFAPLSPYIPYLSVAGNHEMESQNYYTYMKYDDISAFPSGHPLFEKLWTYRLPRILFIGMNTNLTALFSETQRIWLDTTLASAQVDTTIDFVFCFLHHPPVTELWGEGNTSYVENQILGVLKKYSKVQQLSYGHTHAYERGVIESESMDNGGDFRISCVGGGGGHRDRWGEYTNVDYPFIHIALDHYFYILFDFDLAAHSFTGRMFDLGNTDYTVNNEVSDTWHRILGQDPPVKPSALDPTFTNEGRVVLHASPFAGADELMSSQFQVSDKPGDYSSPVVNSLRNWQNIYGIDEFFNPVDLFAGLDITSLEIPAGSLQNSEVYSYRVRYRDQNLRWSEWSDERSFVATDTTGIDEGDKSQGNMLKVVISGASTAEACYFVKRGGRVVLKLINSAGLEVETLFNGELPAGEYRNSIPVTGLSPGSYICRMHTMNGSLSDNFILIR